MTTLPAIRKTSIATIEVDDRPLHVQATYGWSGAEPSYFLTVEGWRDGDLLDSPSLSGEMHTELLQAFPWLGLMAQCQTRCAITGEPQYSVSVEDAWIWFQQDGSRFPFPAGWEQMNGAQRAASYLECDPSMFDDVTTFEEFTNVIDRLRPVWKALTYSVQMNYRLGYPKEDRDS